MCIIVLQHVATVRHDDDMSTFNIPIFTEEFLDHNKGGSEIVVV
jgi:hypothetical protein